MAIRYLSDQNPDGTVLGYASTDKIGFYGKTAIVRQTAITTLASGATIATHRTALNRVINALENLGLLAP